MKKIIFIFIACHPIYSQNGTIMQEKSNWCWAACIQYFINSPIQQKDIVTFLESSDFNNRLLEINNDNFNDICCNDCATISNKILWFADGVSHAPYGVTNFIFSNYNYNSVEENTRNATYQNFYEEIVTENREIILYTTRTDSRYPAKKGTAYLLNSDHFVIANNIYQGSNNPVQVGFISILDPWPLCYGVNYDANFFEMTEGNQDLQKYSARANLSTINASIYYWIHHIYPKKQIKSDSSKPTNKSIICNLKNLLAFSNDPNNLAINYFSGICDNCNDPNRNLFCNFNSKFLKERIRWISGNEINPNLLIKNKFLASKNIYFNRNEQIYQADSINNLQLTIVKKDKKLLGHYKSDTTYQPRPNEEDFYIVSRIDKSFAYLGEFAKSGHAFQKIQVCHNNKKIKIGIGQKDFKLIKYDFLQTHFYVFQKGFTKYAFFEKDTNFKKISNYEKFTAVKLSTLLKDFKKETLEEAKQFANIPNGTLYSR